MQLHSLFYKTFAHTAYNSSNVSRQTGDPCYGAQKLQIWKSSLISCKELMGKPFPRFTGEQVFYCQVSHILQLKNRAKPPKTYSGSL